MRVKIRFVRRAATICGITFGVTWFVRKIMKTQNILGNTFDPSIVEIFEPLVSKINVGYDSSDYSPDWITPAYAQTVLNHGSNFFKFMYARRLLNLAQCDNMMLRKRAVEQLSKLELENWQYSLIAHMSDAKTAVGIARTFNCKENHFLAPPRKFGTYSDLLLLHAMKDYLKILYRSNLQGVQGHPCIEKTTRKIFSEDVDRVIDYDHGMETMTNLAKKANNDNVLLACLEAVRHHSLIVKYSKDILNSNGLYLLMEIYNRFQDNTTVCIHLCNIIANLCIHPDVLESVYKSGWVSVLAKWINHPDIRISGTASQALANLDRDDIAEKYPTDIYLLYPKNRTTEPIAVDVIFIHGLLGNIFYTWRNNESMETTIDLIGKPEGGKEDSIGLSSDVTHKMMASSDPVTQHYITHVNEELQREWDEIGHDFEFVYYDLPEQANEEATGPFSSEQDDSFYSKRTATQCWPRDWLPQDCGNIRVLGINYNTNISAWAYKCPEMKYDVTLEERCTDLIKNLISARVGQRPIVWVTHSMGGLLVKNILSRLKNDENPELKSICDSTKAIVFYSTPHAGSKEANLNATTSYVVWPSTEVMELREDNPALKRIHTEFLDLLKDHPIKVYSFVETKPTVVTALKLMFRLVDLNSGNPGVGECFEVPKNHLGICKPGNRQSFLYQKVLKIVQDVKKASL